MCIHSLEILDSYVGRMKLYYPNLAKLAMTNSHGWFEEGAVVYDAADAKRVKAVLVDLRQDSYL